MPQRLQNDNSYETAHVRKDSVPDSQQSRRTSHSGSHGHGINKDRKSSIPESRQSRRSSLSGSTHSIGSKSGSHLAPDRASTDKRRKSSSPTDRRRRDSGQGSLIEAQNDLQHGVQHNRPKSPKSRRGSIETRVDSQHGVQHTKPKSSKSRRGSIETQVDSQYGAQHDRPKSPKSRRGSITETRVDSQHGVQHNRPKSPNSRRKSATPELTDNTNNPLAPPDFSTGVETRLGGKETIAKGRSRRDTPAVLSKIPTPQPYSFDGTNTTLENGRNSRESGTLTNEGSSLKETAPPDFSTRMETRSGGKETTGKGRSRRDTPAVLSNIPTQEQYSVDATNITQNRGNSKGSRKPINEAGTLQESAPPDFSTGVETRSGGMMTMGKGKKRRDTPVVLSNIPTQQQYSVDKTNITPQNARNRRGSGTQQGTSEASTSEDSIDFLSANIKQFAQPFSLGQRKRTLAKPNL